MGGKSLSDVPVDEAIDKLWTAILRLLAYLKILSALGRPLGRLKDKSEKLNALRFEPFTTRASNGTDGALAQRPPGYRASINSKGTTFAANMPTEEVFTPPAKTGVDGVLYATKLELRGQPDRWFHLILRAGRSSTSTQKS